MMKKTLYIQLLTLLSIILVLVLYYQQPDILEGFEARTYDLRARALRKAVKPSREIAIIAIDDRSIAELGRFPWTREHFTSLLKKTREAGAKAVLFDVIFPEHQDRVVDADLAAAVKRAGNVTLATAFELSGEGMASGSRHNIPVLQQAARNTGHINVFPDEDGVIRWGKLLIAHDGENYPSLGLAGGLAILGRNDFKGTTDGVSAGQRSIPTDGDHRMLINYSGAPTGYERFSFVDVVKGRVESERLKNRVLFVGATALAIYDMRVTPISNNLPGVEVNATIADNIASGDFITRGVAESLLDLLAIILLGVVTVFVTLKVKHSASLPLVLLLTAVYGGIACYLFTSGRWVGIVYPYLSVFLCFAVTAYLRFFFLERKAREIRAMFSCYVSRKVVDELVKNPDLAKVGGESRELTILFADVKNYTSYSEKRSPAEVVRILNEYLAEMTEIILKYDGTLDKFLGDGILAYWNAPLKQENHAELAVRCAHEMMKRMPVLQQKWRQEGDEPLSWGIGLNIGEVIVGTVGAEGKKMEYTAIGDNVNLTYRIQNEGREKEYPVMTRVLYERVKHMADVEPMGHVLVKGKQLPIEIVALQGVR